MTDSYEGSRRFQLVTSPPPAPREGDLLEELRRAHGLSARAASASAGISDTWWREVVQGYRKVGEHQYAIQRASAAVLARMAQVVEATPDQLRSAGRDDAADYLENMLNGEGTEALDEQAPEALDTTGLTAAEVEALQALIEAMRAARSS